MHNMSAIPTPSLYEQIGGEAAVNAAVDLFYRKVLQDDRISQFFDDVDMDPLARLIGAREDGILFGFGDGSVRLAPLSIDALLLKRLFDRQDGEVIRIDW